MPAINRLVITLLMFLLATIYCNNASAQINDNESKMIDLLFKHYAETSPIEIEKTLKTYNIDKTYDPKRLLFHLSYNDLNEVKNADDFDLMISCLQYIPELRSIKIFSKYLSQKHIVSLAKLKIISLVLSPYPDNESIDMKPFQSSKYLQSLVLSDLYATDENLIALTRVPTLVNIGIYHNPKCTTHFIKEYVLNGKSLESVVFTQVSVDEETIKYLCLMRNMKELELSIVKSIKPEWLEILCYSYITNIKYDGEVDWQLFNSYAFKAYLNRRMLNPTEIIDPDKSPFLFEQFTTELDRKFMVRNYGGGK